MDDAAAMPDFRDFFPLERFRPFWELEAGKDDPSTQSARRAAYTGLLSDTMQPALVSYLQALNAAGLLSAIPDGEGHRIRFLDAWNSVIPDESGKTRWKLGTKHAWSCIASTFSHDFIFDATYKRARTEAGMGEAYESLVSHVHMGKPYSDVPRFKDQACDVTGERYELSIDDWQPRFWSYDSHYDKVPMCAIETAAIQQLAFDVPSGELLVADWFRIDEFTEATREVQGDISVNSDVGKVELTQAYLEKLGFLSVFVGNTSPSIIPQDGVLAFGRVEDEEGGRAELGEEGVSTLGYVCTDLWRVTMIEPGSLLDIVASKVGREQAQIIIADYLAEEGDSVVRLRVDAGTHRVYFSGDEETFAQRFKPAALHMSSMVEPMFVLSPRPLELDCEPASGPRM
jgi:hypothetical protein